MGRPRRTKDMVESGPGAVPQRQQMAAPAQQRAMVQPMARAQQAAAHTQMAQVPGQAGLPQPGFPAGPDFEPVAGVTLEQFAAVSKGIAVYNYDQSRLAEVAASRGIDPVSWDTASQGWNGRIQSSPAVAQQFNRLYRAS